MKLLEIDIRNLKSLTRAKLTFPPTEGHHVSLLYGDNGAGKTTVLEAVSLLGHVSTMRRICAGGPGGAVDMKPSLFRERKSSAQALTPDPTTALREHEHERYAGDAFDDQVEVISRTGLEAWWETTPISGDPYRPARIKYSVLFRNQQIHFFISFLQHHDLSITEALSRDQNGPGERIHDGNMDNWFALVYDLTQRDHVTAFIEHIYSVSPHSYWPAVGNYQTDPRSTRRPDSQEIVAYWNTDLNDFGRKNDLRESVKKIRIDFRGQMIDRLGLSLPITSNNTTQYYDFTTSEKVPEDKLEPLNDSLKRALIDHAVAMQRERKKLKHGLIRIAEIDARDDPATMKARRINEDKDIEIDHLSAGENESVFIFLLMLGMPCKDSIILLDEPDLHLSDFAKSRFYRELYRIAAAAGCQLIVSTHSAFAYTVARSRSHHFIRREVSVDAKGVPYVVYATEWNSSFGELLTFYYARCAVNAMREAGFMWRCLAKPLQASIWVGERSGLEVWVLVTIFAAFLGLYSAAATTNDIFLLVHDDPALHREIIKVAAILCAILCSFFLSIRFIPRLMRRA